MSKKTYLVTGGTGFLGTAVVEQLLSANHNVRVLARDKKWLAERNKNNDNNNANCEFIEGSISSFDSIIQAAKGVDGIFHLAGVVTHSHELELVESMRKTNVDGTINVIEAAEKTSQTTNKPCRIVYASTSGVVGCSSNPNYIAKDESPYCTETVQNLAYYIQKIEIEKLAFQLAKEKNVEFVAMRPTLVLGPGDVRLSSIRVIRDFLNRAIPFKPCGGVSMVDVRDAAAAFILAMESPQANGKSYLLGAYNNTMSQFFSLLQEISGVRAPLFSSPKFATIWGACLLNGIARLVTGKRDPSLDPAYATMGTLFWYISPCNESQAHQELGWTVRTPESTIKDTIEWIRNNEDLIKSYESGSTSTSGSSSSGSSSSGSGSGSGSSGSSNEQQK